MVTVTVLLLTVERSEWKTNIVSDCLLNFENFDLPLEPANSALSVFRLSPASTSTLPHPPAPLAWKPIATLKKPKPALFRRTQRRTPPRQSTFGVLTGAKHALLVCYWMANTFVYCTAPRVVQMMQKPSFRWSKTWQHSLRGRWININLPTRRWIGSSVGWNDLPFSRLLLLLIWFTHHNRCKV